MVRPAVRGATDAAFREFARGCGAAGFTFDDLCRSALGDERSLADAADWLARSNASGDLLDLGSETLSDGTPLGPRRYCLAKEAAKAVRLDLRLPAEPRSVTTMRWAAGEFAERHSVRRPDDVRLAVSEAVTNAVLHAYPEDEDGEVRLVTCAEPERLVVVVRDWGGHGLRPRVDSPGMGVGLPTMATLADLFNIETPAGGGTLIRLHFARA
jgi:serine/threonine-protein kinase RsbW